MKALKICFLISLCVIKFIDSIAQDDLLMPVMKNGKWGVADSRGNLFISYQYNRAEYIPQNQLIIVREDTLEKVVDKNNSTVIPLSYDKIKHCGNNYFLIQKNDKTGLYHTEKGEILPPDFQYSTLNEHTYYFKKEDSVKNIHILNVRDDCIFSHLTDRPKRKVCINGIWYQELYSGSKKGIADENFQPFIPVEYDDIKSYCRYWILFKNDHAGVLDSMGNTVLPMEYDDINYGNNRLILEKDGKFGIYDLISQTQIATQSDSIHIGDNHFFLYRDDEIDIYDINLKYINTISWQLKKRTPAGYWYYYDNGNLGILNTNFNIIAQARYSQLREAGSLFSEATRDGRKGLVSHINGAFYQIKFENLNYLEGYYYKYGYKNRYGVIAAHRGQVLPAQFEDVEYIPDAGFIAHIDNREVLLSMSGKQLSKAYFRIEHLGSDYFRVANENDQKGIILANGKMVLQTRYGNVRFSSALDLLLFRSNSFQLYIGNVDTTQYYLSKPDTVKFSPHAMNKFYVSPDEKNHIRQEFIEGKTDLCKLSDNELIKANAYPIYKWGIANRYGEILADSLYYRGEISIDETYKQIRITKNGTQIVISLDNNNRFIDKVYYKHWIDVELHKAKPKAEQKNRWHQTSVNKQGTMLWGLLSDTGEVLIKHKFHTVYRNYMNDTNLVLTATRDRSYRIFSKPGTRYKTQPTLYNYGIVDELLAKELQMNSFSHIYNKDFQYAKVARCLTPSGNFWLMNEDFELTKSYSYIDGFQKGYARVCKKGALACREESTYNLVVDTTYFPECLTCEKGKLSSKGGKWGIIDSLGNLVVALEYDFIQRIRDNELIVEKNGQWGMVTLGQQSIIDLKYQEIKYFTRESGEWVDCPYLLAKKNNKWGVIDRNDNIHIPFKFEDISYLPNSKGDFFAARENGYWGLINKEQKVIIPFRFSGISYFNDLLTNYFEAETESYLYGYIDTAGVITCEPKFRKAMPFCNHFARVKDKQNRWRFINRRYEFISDRHFEEIRDFHNGLAAFKKGKYWGFVDTTGQTIVEPQYRKAGDFSDGIAYVRMRTKKRFFGLIRGKRRYTYINTKGEILFTPKFKKAESSQNGAAMAYKSGKKYIITPEGEIIFSTKHYISEFNKYGLAVFSDKNRKKGLLNNKGEVILKPDDIQDIEPFSEGYAQVKINNRCGFIDTLGNIVISPQYLRAGHFSDGLVRVNTLEGWGYRNVNSLIIRHQFIKCTDFKGGRAVVEKNSLINKKGEKTKLPVPVKDIVHQFDDGSVIVKDWDFNYHIIDKRGIKSDKNAYREIIPYKSSLNIVRKDKNYSIVDNFGNAVVEPVIASIRPFSEGKSPFLFKKQFGLYDCNGNCLAEPVYYQSKKFLNGYYRLYHFNHVKYVEMP